MKNASETLQEKPDTIRYAGFGKRLKAFAFDYLPIAAYIILLFGLSLGAARLMDLLGRPLRWPENPLLGDLLAFVILVLPVDLPPKYVPVIMLD